MIPATKLAVPCKWIFNWYRPEQDCGLNLGHESPHVQGDIVEIVRREPCAKDERCQP